MSRTWSRDSMRPRSASASADPSASVVDPPCRAPPLLRRVCNGPLGFPRQSHFSRATSPWTLWPVASFLRVTRGCYRRTPVFGLLLRYSFAYLYWRENRRAAQVLLEEERQRAAGLSEALAVRDREYQAREEAQAAEL
nr:hypothetical protein Iba_chr04dCG13460 [Ipomoea batatas]